MSPRLRSCEICGLSYVSGIPSDVRIHRLRHEAAVEGPRTRHPDGIVRSTEPFAAHGAPLLGPFRRAALAYQVEAGWDFTPLDIGDESARYIMVRAGRIVGFAIVGWHEYEKAGRLREVEHLWTARAARRTGVATAVISAALRDGPIHHYGGPLTKDGEAFVLSRPMEEWRRWAGRIGRSPDA